MSWVKQAGSEAAKIEATMDVISGVKADVLIRQLQSGVDYNDDAVYVETALQTIVSKANELRQQIEETRQRFLKERGVQPGPGNT